MDKISNNIFQIDLNIEIIDKLVDKVNEQNYISYQKRFKGNKKEYSAWDKICAIINRLYDTVFFLSELKLNTGKYERNAFDFFEFMDNASVVVDCIEELAKIFEVPTDKITMTSYVFNKLGSDGKGTDRNYFKYLRSLCSVHPINTSRHRNYQDNDFECCPFVVWNNRNTYDDNSDIYAIVYTSNDSSKNKRVPIYMNQIFKYVKTRLDFVNDIVDKIGEYQKGVIQSFIDTPIKKENEFNSYVDYLNNLDSEQRKRFGSERFYPISDVIKFFKVKFFDKENQEKFNLYLNALKYAITFEHNSIQNMSIQGFKNNGLICNNETLQTTLFIELNSLESNDPQLDKYRYYLEKIDNLICDSSNERQLAYIQVQNMLPFLKKYVSFDNVKESFEFYALVKLALYLNCLENDCLVNNNIPNNLNYRQFIKQ